MERDKHPGGWHMDAMSYEATTELGGMVFGRLTVISRQEVGMWNCVCLCGTRLIVSQNSLRTGNTRSCGCLAKEVQSKRLTKHGWFGTQLHKRWMSMRGRCAAGGHYHKRGIGVCPEWDNSFTAFRDWAIGSGYEPDLQLDRVDNDAGYSPVNCRWATRAKNMNNRSNTVMVSAFGENKSLSEWAEDERCAVSRSALLWRIRHGEWAPEAAITTPSKAQAI